MVALNVRSLRTGANGQTANPLISRTNRTGANGRERLHRFDKLGVTGSSPVPPTKFVLFKPGARFLRVSERFDVEFAGVWALVRIDSEERREAMRAESDAQVLPPLTPSERSVLRVELLAALHEELAP